MKRATNEDPTWRKHRRCNLPHTSATALLDRPWAERAHSITNWIESVPESAPYCNSFDSSTADSAQVLDSMSDSSRRRERRHRSCSPIKKSEQYRSTVLKPSNIFVDTAHSLPPEIEVLLPQGLRGILNHVLPPAGILANIDNKVIELATVYRDECRELSKIPGSEPEYRALLFSDVVVKLARPQARAFHLIEPQWTRTCY
jgi:hypothetical protein